MRVETTNHSFLTSFGLEPDEVVGRRLHDIGGGEWDRPDLLEPLQTILPQRTAFENLELTGGFANLRDRTLLLNARQLDHVQKILLGIHDVTDRKRSERLRERLMGELSHRVKNTLASVQATARHMGRNYESILDFLDAFHLRLQALARAHSIISLASDETIEFQTLLDRELEPYIERGDDRTRLTGGSLPLVPQDAIAVHLVLHELVTNAAKHGALSNDRGRLAIDWVIEGAPDEPRAHVQWTETGGPTIDEIHPRGCGMSLVEISVRHDLGGTLLMDLNAEGLRCDIAFPLSRPADLDAIGRLED